MVKIIKSFVLFTFLVLPSLVSSSNFETKLVTWSDLRKLNYKTGEMPESIRKLMGKPIKIPGFAPASCHIAGIFWPLPGSWASKLKVARLA